MQAIEDLAMTAPGSRAERLDNQRRARRWLDSEIKGGIGSFTWICGVLDLDPDRTRSLITTKAPTFTAADLRRLCHERVECAAGAEECGDARE